MFRKFLLSILFASFISASFSQEAPESYIWECNRLDSIGGFPLSLYGDPVLIEIDSGTVIEFDGIDDGLLVPANPLAGAEEFTVEVIFLPYSGGLEEQRFVHFQQDDQNRALIELRSTADQRWFLDTFIKSGTSNCVLYAENHLHETHVWQHAALVYRQDSMFHFVNGELELSDTISYVPVSSGSTSLGVRQNLVSWYKGAIRLLKITHKALDPSEFHLDMGGSSSSAEGYSYSGKDAGVKFYPNPVRDIANIDYSMSERGDVMFQLYNTNATRIASFKKADQEAGLHTRALDLSGMKPGVYFYTLLCKREWYAGKFLLLN